MALKKTQLVSIQSVTGIQTVGIYTAGLTATSVGVGSTSYVRSIIIHNAGAAANNSGVGTARVGLYVYPNTCVTDRVSGVGNSAYRIAQFDVAPRETTFFESNYPIVLAPFNAIAVDVVAPDTGGVGTGTAINFVINGDTDS